MSGHRETSLDEAVETVKPELAPVSHVSGHDTLIRLVEISLRASRVDIRDLIWRARSDAKGHTLRQVGAACDVAPKTSL